MAFTDERGRRRVVVTGLGAVTPLGLDAETLWSGLKGGRSGIDRITSFDTAPYACKVAGEVKSFEPRDYLDAKEARRMSRTSHLVIAATRQALDAAHFVVESDNAEDVGVLLGTGIGSMTTIEREARVMFERGGMKTNPFFMTMMLPNMPAGNVSRVFGAKGYCSTVVTACAASSQAIGEAAEVIRRGSAKAMLAGGAEGSLCELMVAGFATMRALTAQPNPKEASRPFDAERDGFVPAEGAATLVLEDLEHAVGRGAPILAELVGFGVSADAYHVSAPEPDGEGAARSMRQALRDAGLDPARVDYISAHATSTPLGDASETAAIKRVFGEHAPSVPVSAPKSMLGHLLGAAGAVESIACILSLRDGIVHPTINYEHPDPACDLDYVPNVARSVPVAVSLNNSFGFGGQNTTLIFKRYEG
ncbi:MAG: beta-ketoacyl-ACP synthase II [Chloroflexi bacterium]|nr:beta-ketoacyl-ACP synthase II [Chloroflexota bacterium]